MKVEQICKQLFLTQFSWYMMFGLVNVEMFEIIPTLLNYVFYLFHMMSGSKVIKKGNDFVTLHFA